MGLLLAVVLLIALYLTPTKTLSTVDRAPIKFVLVLSGCTFISFGGWAVFTFFRTLSARQMTTTSFRLFAFYATLSVAYSALAMPRLAQLTFSLPPESTSVDLDLRFSTLEVASYTNPTLGVCVAGFFLLICAQTAIGILEKKLECDL